MGQIKEAPFFVRKCQLPYLQRIPCWNKSCRAKFGKPSCSGKPKHAPVTHQRKPRQKILQNLGLAVTSSQDHHQTNFHTISEKSVSVDRCLFVNIDNLVVTLDIPRKPTVFPFLPNSMLKDTILEVKDSPWAWELLVHTQQMRVSLAVDFPYETQRSEPVYHIFTKVTDELITWFACSILRTCIMWFNLSYSICLRTYCVYKSDK